MKQKNILIAIFLIVPLLPQAQFTTDLSISPGFDQMGLTFKGGLNANYDFNDTWGISSGFYYSYYKSDNTFLDDSKSFNAIGIPISILYKIKSSRFQILLGTIANYNLNEKLRDGPDSFVEYEKFFLQAELGLFYRFNDNIKLGISADTGITSFYDYRTSGDPISSNHMLRSINFRFNYTL